MAKLTLESRYVGDTWAWELSFPDLSEDADISQWRFIVNLIPKPAGCDLSETSSQSFMIGDIESAGDKVSIVINSEQTANISPGSFLLVLIQVVPSDPDIVTTLMYEPIEIISRGNIALCQNVKSA